jgi:hypothetical protein
MEIGILARLMTRSGGEVVGDYRQDSRPVTWGAEIDRARSPREHLRNIDKNSRKMVSCRDGIWIVPRWGSRGTVLQIRHKEQNDLAGVRTRRTALQPDLTDT